MKDGGGRPGKRQKVLVPPESPAVRAPRTSTSSATPQVPIQSFCADELATAALTALRAASQEIRCDGCDELIDGEPFGRGLYCWSRAGEIRYDEPALCEECATSVGVVAERQFDIEDEEG